MLPDAFADLSDFLEFALLDDEARGELRIRRPIEEITAFYEAMLPRFPDVMAYLADVDPNPASLGERERTLLALAVAFVEIGNTVEHYAPAGTNGPDDLLIFKSKHGLLGNAHDPAGSVR